MLCRAMIVLGTALSFVGPRPTGEVRGEETIVPGSLVCAPDASFAERLAAHEIRRYLYLRTGRLLPLHDRLDQGANTPIIVGTKTSPIVRDTGAKLDNLG